VHQLLLSLDLPPAMMVARSFLIGIPSSLMVAYLFHTVFERPFMSHFSLNVKSQTTDKKILSKHDRGWSVSSNGNLTSTETKFSTSVKKLLEWLQEYMSVDTVTLLLPVKNQENLAVYATLGLEEEIVQKIRIPVGRGFAGRIASTKKPIIVNNLSEIEIVSPILRNKGLQSLVGIPLPIQENSIGVLHIGTFESKHFSERDVKALQGIANLIESMIEDTGFVNFELAEHNQENSRSFRLRYVNSIYQLFTINISALKIRLLTLSKLTSCYGG
jgi:transcriptional regulator with GAF, ATPase, and Fis domain